MDQPISRKQRRLEARAQRRAERSGYAVEAGELMPGSPRLGEEKDLGSAVRGMGAREVGLIGGVPVYGVLADEATLQQMQTCLRDERAAHGALMADNHRGYSMPIGGVVGYRRAVSLTGAGVDIGCGNNAAMTSLTARDLGVDRERLGRERMPEVERIMDEVVRRIRFGVGTASHLGKDHPLLDDPRWTVTPFIADLHALARDQMGTVGGGNHYVDLLLDQQDRVWVANHFGSRGLGFKTFQAFMNLAHNRAHDDRPMKEDMMAPGTVLDMDRPLGQDYWTAMELAGDYARHGRRLVIEEVSRILGAQVLDTVEANHNLSWRETHDVGQGSEELIVARKGATPAAPGQLGFVGGSMGDDAVIIRGLDTPAARAGLRSAMHGAGRQLSRTQAAGKMNYRTRTRDGGAVTAEAMQQWIGSRGVVLRGGDTDESPQAYKRLSDVVAAHQGTVEVVHTLRPIGVAMAGRGDHDPYKD